MSVLTPEQKTEFAQAMATAFTSRDEPDATDPRPAGEPDRELGADLEPGEPGTEGAEFEGAEPDSGQHAEGSSADGSGAAPSQPSRSQLRIQQLAAEAKAAKEEAAAAKAAADKAVAQAQWLLTPDGQRWQAAQRGQDPGQRFNWEGKSDDQVAAELLTETQRIARRESAAYINGELNIREAIGGLATKFKDFDVTKDGHKVRQILNSGVIQDPEAAYFAAFPERVKEREAHAKRGRQSAATVSSGGARATKPRSPDSADVARRQETFERAAKGDRSAFGAVLAEAHNSRVEAGRKSRRA